MLTIFVESGQFIFATRNTTFFAPNVGGWGREIFIFREM